MAPMDGLGTPRDKSVIRAALVLTAMFVYDLTVRTGQFELVKDSIAGLASDRRIQVLLIAFCFGAFIEGSAGFGTPVAVTSVMLMALGFRPIKAAVLALVANTAPVAFGALGTIVGIYAEQWDHTTFISNIVILPLAFVGGVFYSVDMLGSPWEELSHFNPVFYLVNAVRFGFLGESDVSVWLSLGVTAALALPVYAWSQWLFTTGRRLKD